MEVVNRSKLIRVSNEVFNKLIAMRTHERETFNDTIVMMINKIEGDNGDKS
jgi:predicted CopG family antitoxin